MFSDTNVFVHSTLRYRSSQYRYLNSNVRDYLRHSPAQATRRDCENALGPPHTYHGTRIPASLSFHIHFQLTTHRSQTQFLLKPTHAPFISSTSNLDSSRSLSTSHHSHGGLDSYSNLPTPLSTLLPQSNLSTDLTMCGLSIYTFTCGWIHTSLPTQCNQSHGKNEVGWHAPCRTEEAVPRVCDLCVKFGHHGNAPAGVLRWARWVAGQIPSPLEPARRDSAVCT